MLMQYFASEAVVQAVAIIMLALLVALWMSFRQASDAAKQALEVEKAKNEVRQDFKSQIEHARKNAVTVSGE